MDKQIFALVAGKTLLRLVPPTKASICIYTRKLYNKADLTQKLKNTVF